MQKKFQIFISSTFIDLEEERRAVIEAILDLGHVPIGMEAFQAGNEEQWDYIKKRIDESDYYVVLVAERYGSEKDGVSYTEMEYNYARAQNVPVAAFLLAEEARTEWRAKKADYIDNPQKLNAFREKCRKLLCKQWKSKDELARLCSNSINTLIRDFPRDGWIPAKQALSPDVANELARLSKENEELREKQKILNSDFEVNNFISEMKINSIYLKNAEIISYYEIFYDLRINLLNKLKVDIIGDSLHIIKYNTNNNRYERIFFDINETVCIINFFQYLKICNAITTEGRIVNIPGSGFSCELTEFGKRVVRRMVQLRQAQAESA